jgi:hypothetical protein
MGKEDAGHDRRRDFGVAIPKNGTLHLVLSSLSCWNDLGVNVDDVRDGVFAIAKPYCLSARKVLTENMNVNA